MTVAEMDVPGHIEWEMLLIDNGSVDETAAVVASFQDRIPIRRVVEPKLGLSNARNRGIQEAAGDYICWTDDDVLIERSWLSAYAHSFHANPGASFFGGPIQPVLEGRTPLWFEENRHSLANLLAERDLGDAAIQLSQSGDRLPYGANFAVRVQEQRRHPYDPDLGVAPHQRRLGEETAMLLEIVREGGAGVYVPGARVRHIIPEARQTLSYVGIYQQSIGETWAYLSRNGQENFMGASVSDKRTKLLGVPVWMLMRASAHQVFYVLLHKRADSPIWMKHWLKYNYYRGAIRHWSNAANNNDHVAVPQRIEFGLSGRTS